MSKKENNRLEHVKNHFLRKNDEQKIAHVHCLWPGWEGKSPTLQNVEERDAQTRFETNSFISDFTAFSKSQEDNIEKFSCPSLTADEASRVIEEIIGYLNDKLENVLRPYEHEYDRTVNLQAYLQWLFYQISPEINIGVKLEDVDSLIDDLAIFNFWKNKRQFIEHVRSKFPNIKNPADINHYAKPTSIEQINEFYRILHPFRKEGALSPTERDEIDKKFFNNHGATLIHQNSKWPNSGFRLLRINTYEASKNYGRRTKWCTSHRNTSEWFDKYKGNILFFESTVGERIQIDFNTAQWQDIYNKPINLGSMVRGSKDRYLLLDLPYPDGEVIGETSKKPDDKNYTCKPSILKDSEELADVLYIELEKSIRDSAKRMDHKTLGTLLRVVNDVEEWAEKVKTEEILTDFFDMLSKEDSGEKFAKLVYNFSTVADPRKFIDSKTISRVLTRAFNHEGDPLTIAKIFATLVEESHIEDIVTQKDLVKGHTILANTKDPRAQEVAQPFMSHYLTRKLG